MRILRLGGVAVVAIALTALGTLIYLNLTVGKRQLLVHPNHRYAIEDPRFARALDAMFGPPLVGGNAIDALQNGDQIFPAMLGAIRDARSSINLESYVYWSGEIGRRFADSLIERARSGVQVRVLLDWMGSVPLARSTLRALREAGVAVVRVRRPVWYRLDELNNRTHRKLLIVDGRVGFTGGAGIADAWTGNAQDPDHWRDTHFRVRGPVVAQMQAAFNDNWMKATGRMLQGDAHFPPLAPIGDLHAQMIISSPDGGGNNMRLMVLSAITAATESLQISTAYFVPDTLVMESLITAAYRGVKVRIIAPSDTIDHAIVRLASRDSWGPLLEAGIEIAEYQPTMYHTKMLIADGRLVSVGSTNFDIRSFTLNDEANLNIYDEDFAARQQEVFEADWANARRVTLQAWRDRPLVEKLAGFLASLLRSQL